LFQFQLANKVVSLITQEEYFGKVEENQINDFKTKLRQLYPHSILFKTKEEQEAELNKCLQNLSIASTTDQLADKLATTNIKS
jgi:hypothetical protein